MESERGRKRTESQLQEMGARLAQADREREEREDRVQKLQVLICPNTLQPKLTWLGIKNLFLSDTCLRSIFYFFFPV